MGETKSAETPRPESRKAEKSWIPPRKRATKHVTNAEDILPRDLDPMYQGMKRTSTVAKHALFANYRAEVKLRKSLDTYNNICREEVNQIAHGQRQMTRGFRYKERRKVSIARARSAPILPRSIDDRKYRYTGQSLPSSRSIPEVEYDSDTDSRPATSRKWTGLSQKLTNRPKTAPHQVSFFLTDNEDGPKRKRPMTAMELINVAEPLQSRIEPEDIDQNRLRTSSYYRRVTSPSLQGVVSTELAAYFRRMHIKI